MKRPVWSGEGVEDLGSSRMRSGLLRTGTISIRAHCTYFSRAHRDVCSRPFFEVRTSCRFKRYLLAVFFQRIISSLINHITRNGLLLGLWNHSEQNQSVVTFCMANPRTNPLSLLSDWGVIIAMGIAGAAIAIAGGAGGASGQDSYLRFNAPLMSP